VTPELTLAGDLKKRVHSVTGIDEQNFKVTLNATDPQFQLLTRAASGQGH